MSDVERIGIVQFPDVCFDPVCASASGGGGGGGGKRQQSRERGFFYLFI